MSSPDEDHVRILRILEYSGPRSEVERTLANSIQGERLYGKLHIRAATIGQFPEIMDTLNDEEET